jgi:hypothetical protein
MNRLLFCGIVAAVFLTLAVGCRDTTAVKPANPAPRPKTGPTPSGRSIPIDPLMQKGIDKPGKHQPSR